MFSSILGAESIEPDLLQPGNISELHTYQLYGLSRAGKDAVFALRPDHDPGAIPDHQTFCFDQSDTIEKLTFEGVRRSCTCLFLGLEIEVGETVHDCTPAALVLEKPLESISFPWRKVFTRFLGEEKIAMAFSSQWLSHLKRDSILREDMSDAEHIMEPAEQQAEMWTKDQLAKAWPGLACSERGMMSICRTIARRARLQGDLEDDSGMADYSDLLSEHEWYRRSMQGITEGSSAMVEYHKILSDHRWYRNPMQRTTESPSNRPRLALPSHGPCRLSSRPAVQERPQHVQQSEATGPSDMDVDLAPDPRSLGNAVTPTKPSSGETPTLPKAPNKLIRKFSEADLEEYTSCSKHPRLVVYPETATPEPEIATISLDALEAETQQMKIPPSLPSANERRLIYNPEDFSGHCTGRMDIMSTFAEEKEEEGEEHDDDDDKNDHTYHFEELSDAGTSSMEAASSLASEEEYDDDDYQDGLTYNSENCSETGTSSMEGTSSFNSKEEEEENEEEEMYTYNSQGTSEAEMERMETMLSLGPEDEDMFADDESSK